MVSSSGYCSCKLNFRHIFGAIVTLFMIGQKPTKLFICFIQVKGIHCSFEDVKYDIAPNSMPLEFIEKTNFIDDDRLKPLNINTFVSLLHSLRNTEKCFAQITVSYIKLKFSNLPRTTNCTGWLVSASCVVKSLAVTWHSQAPSSKSIVAARIQSEQSPPMCGVGDNVPYDAAAHSYFFG